MLGRANIFCFESFKLIYRNRSHDSRILIRVAAQPTLRVSRRACRDTRLPHVELHSPVGAEVAVAKSRPNSKNRSSRLQRPALKCSQIHRLLVFQDDCLRSADQGTHRFDRWMIHFLPEHYIPLHQRSEYPRMESEIPAVHEYRSEDFTRRIATTTKVLARLWK